MANLGGVELTVKNLLSPILSKLKITDFTLEINSGSGKGEGYLGDIYNVKVNHKNGHLDLIVKVAAKDKTVRQSTHAAIAYRNEINFYNEIFPEMDSLQKEKRVSSPFLIPKYYGNSLIEREEALILENLKTQGYKIHDRMKVFDEAHIILVLENYAKFHALSYALRSQRPEIFKKLANTTENMFLMFSKFMNPIKAQIKKFVEKLKRHGLKKESEAVQRIAETAGEILYMNEKPPDEYTVIAHGDCWTHNIMFKYDAETDEPIEMRFIDFQLMRTVSPVADLSYFLCACASEDTINNLEDYLEIYYNALNDFLKDLGCNVEVLYPFRIFMEHWKKYGKFGLTMSLWGLRAVLAEENEIISFATVEEFARSMSIDKIENQDEYDKRIIYLLKKFVALDWA